MEPQHCEDNSNFGLTNSRCMDLQFNQQVENVGVRLDENAVGGPGGIGGAAADSAVCMGAKFEEHLDGGGDDEEWKYIKENLQSEKQQTQPELMKGFGNGDSAAHENDELFEQFDGNHVFGNGGAVAATNGSENGANVELDVEAATHDSEFSTSNTSTSHTPGDEKDVTADVVQVEMKIESVPQHPVVEDFDEEEPSSLATNGTSSLSENQPQQIIRQDDHSTDCENKERPNELDIEMHSQLNPEAKEFVPSFGSNPASPVISPAAGLAFETEKTETEPTSNDVARHLLGHPNQTDDFIAQSPHKERCADMEAIQLPAEIDFDIGADNRPHELKEEILLESAADAGGDDNYDQNRQSPGSFVDHGPETSVDLENEFNGESQQINDVMKQSIYVESNVTEEPIEDLLNTVQPLPMSFNDESELMQQLATEKEMLQVDEKEHISHSPSTEEMQMNLRNDFYTAEHSTAPTNEFGFESEQNVIDNACQGEQQPAFLQFPDQTLLMDVSNPFNNSNVSAMADTEASFEMVQNLPANSQNAQTNDEQDNFIGHTEPSHSPHELKLNIDFEHDLTKQNNEAPTSPSPLSTEEKHLVEDTKESPKLATDISDLAQNMRDLQLSHHDDGNSTQMEPICDIANAINENANLISVQEPMQFEVDKQKEPLHDFDLLQTEQMLQPQHEAEKQEMETEHFDEKPNAEIIEPAVEAETKLSNVEPPFKDDETNAIVAAAAAAVAATTAAVATASVAADTKKSDAPTAKKSTTTSALTSKPKKAVVESKRPLDAKKTTTSTTTATAKTAPAPRPRTAPTARAPVTSSSNAVTEKKSTTSLTATTSAGNAAAARKTFTARPVPKTTTIAPRPATAHAALKTATSSATAAAKTTTQPAAARRATSSASAAALGSRARASGGSSPTKPTTLNVTTAASAKPKQISPRSNITSQARKGGVAGNALAANPSARSPTKATSSNVDLIAKTGAASNRSKGVAVAASAASIATSTTKRFVARPAPKSTAAGAVNTTTTTTKTTTTRRITSSSGSKNIAAAEKASLASNNSAVSKKSSPKAPALSPRLGTNNKTGNTTNTTKSPRTKDGTDKKISPLPKSAAAAAAAPAPITKPKPNGTIEELKLNGDVGIENGVHHDFETAEQLIATVNEVVGDADAAVVAAAAAAAANVAAESQEATLIDA